MKKRNYWLKVLLILFFVITSFCYLRPAKNTRQKKHPLQLGAYYYGGWSAHSKNNLTTSLRDSFPERKPIWGWYTQTPEIIKSQIDVAADAGLSFFSFCWYYSNLPDNDALKLYLQAPNKKRLKFSLMVANHAGYIIGPENWPAVTKTWIALFKDPQYLKVNGKPYLTFFSMETLLDEFGSVAAVQQALNVLKKSALDAGLPGITIAVCIGPEPKKIIQARDCGFDILTGYNYHPAGFWHTKATAVPIDSMTVSSRPIWNVFKTSDLPYVPVATLNWDPRPWATPANNYKNEQRYTGYSGSSVYQSVLSLAKWVKENPEHTTPDCIALLYAWNEYGEGAWLTPSDQLKDSLLKGVKRALSASHKNQLSAIK